MKVLARLYKGIVMTCIMLLFPFVMAASVIWWVLTGKDILSMYLKFMDDAWEIL